MLSDWFRSTLKEKKVKQVEMARVLTDRLGRSIDAAAVNKMTLGKRNIAADELLEIEKYLGIRAPRQEDDDSASVPQELETAWDHDAYLEALRRLKLLKAKVGVRYIGTDDFVDAISELYQQVIDERK